MRPPVPPRRDVLLAVALYAVDVTVFSDALVDGVRPGELLLMALGFVPVAWRVAAPRLVLGLVLVHVLVTGLLLPEYLPTAALMAALYTVATQYPLRESLSGWVIAWLVYTPVAAIGELRTTAVDQDRGVAAVLALFYALLLGAAWAAGRWAGLSRRRMDSLEHRRRVAAAEAVTAERSRIARELHDIVSHSVSVMVLQAAGARRVLDRDPDRAADALVQIEGVGRQSMEELRRLLGVLRDGRFVSGDGDDGLGPHQGLADLAELLDSYRSTGLTVRSEVTGRPGRLDGSVDLSAYRIVKEGLTNTVKHAGPQATVVVRQVWADDLLLLELVDDGRGGGTGGALSTGHGLAGLRERARAVGGRLSTEALPDKGFRLSARLPVDQGERR